MRNGTQEELDAAKDDAMLIPLHTKYKIANTNRGVGFCVGETVSRNERIASFDDSSACVAMWDDEASECWYVAADNLEPI